MKARITLDDDVFDIEYSYYDGDSGDWNSPAIPPEVDLEHIELNGAELKGDSYYWLAPKTKHPVPLFEQLEIMILKEYHDE